MRLIFASLIALASIANNKPAPAEDIDGARFLSGNWELVDERFPHSCDFPSGHGDQIWFEFARSGGRALHYEAADLFTSYGGLSVRNENNILVVTAKTRSGEIRPFMRIRPKGANEAEIVKAPGDTHSIGLHRCDAAGTSVTQGLSDTSLFALTPPETGGQGFPQVLPGESTADVCEGKIALDWRKPPRRWVQFELIGPAHYWAMFDFRDSDAMVSDYHDIVAARQLTTDTVGLTIRGWGKRSTKDISIRIGSDRIEIPELQTTFARCKSDQMGSLGMHRM